jgi:hypothetical protein
MRLLSQRPDGTIVSDAVQYAGGVTAGTTTPPDVLVCCDHRGSQRRCCADLWICRVTHASCNPAANPVGPVLPGVRRCRDCSDRSGIESLAVMTSDSGPHGRVRAEETV